MVYSGDTRPCPSLVRAAKDATLLIHEAAFENGMEEAAKKKRHSTTGEAVQTGIDARCYRTILTHFSQPHPKIPVFDESYTARTMVAFDLMSGSTLQGVRVRVPRDSYRRVAISLRRRSDRARGGEAATTRRGLPRVRFNLTYITVLYHLCEY